MPSLFLSKARHGEGFRSAKGFVGDVGLEQPVRLGIGPDVEAVVANERVIDVEVVAKGLAVDENQRAVGGAGLPLANDGAGSEAVDGVDDERAGALFLEGSVDLLVLFGLRSFGVMHGVSERVLEVEFQAR